ncbi:MAG: TIGR03668 family PPOX class F420-dependent oxidoreductase [Acidimicrobiia bacterium]
MDVWEKLETSRVAVLATVNPDGSPHLIPVVYALVGERIVTAVDGKPKSTARLRRLTNLDANPSVCLLVHHYEEKWDRLWWARIDGRATVVAADPEALSALRKRYRQYETVALAGPVISIEVSAVRSWPT